MIVHKFQCMKINAGFTWNDGLQGRHYFRAGIGTHKISHTHGVQVAWDSCTGNMSIILADGNFDTLIAKSRCDKNGHKRVTKKWSQALSPPPFFPPSPPFLRSHTPIVPSLSLTHHLHDLIAWNRLCRFWKISGTLKHTFCLSCHIDQ